MNAGYLAGLIFVAVFAGVVLIHELGHFFMGRLFKVEIEEFGIGLPPRMLTLFHWKETAFSLNWLPLGGFNRFKGENDPNVPGGLAAANPWVRLAVLLAGASMNIAAGVLVYSILFTQIGIPDFSSVKLYEVTPGSPAELAGLKADDIVLNAGSEQITNDEQLRSIIRSNLDQPLQLTVQRGSQVLKITATPSSKRTAEEGALGFLPGYASNPAGSWFATLPYSINVTFSQAYHILSFPAQLIRGSISPEDCRFIGLKGIYDFFRQAVSRDVESRVPVTAAPTTPIEPTHFTLNLVAILTITLGVFNLLPFPALDGGRILFVIPEIVLRRRVPPGLENTVHAAGMMILLAFMLYVNVMDFVNPANVVFP